MTCNFDTYPVPRGLYDYLVEYYPKAKIVVSSSRQFTDSIVSRFDDFPNYDGAFKNYEVFKPGEKFYHMAFDPDSGDVILAIPLRIFENEYTYPAPAWYSNLAITRFKSDFLSRETEILNLFESMAGGDFRSKKAPSITLNGFSRDWVHVQEGMTGRFLDFVTKKVILRPVTRKVDRVVIDASMRFHGCLDVEFSRTPSIDLINQTIEDAQDDEIVSFTRFNPKGLSVWFCDMLTTSPKNAIEFAEKSISLGRPRQEFVEFARRLRPYISKAKTDKILAFIEKEFLKGNQNLSKEKAIIHRRSPGL